jgi:hypothetical protein
MRKEEQTIMSMHSWICTSSVSDYTTKVRRIQQFIATPTLCSHVKRSELSIDRAYGIISQCKSFIRNNGD